MCLAAVYIMHCTFTTSNNYSSPSVVMAAYRPDGSQLIIDDFREAYSWLRINTPPDSIVMAWWDYGYQIAGFANRTTLVDNNTWNYTHIATVGKAFASSEAEAYALLQTLDVDYVLVVFGGAIGFGGDDINKFLWMARIAEDAYPHDVREADFFNEQGEFRVDAHAAPAFKASLMYKLCYYGYAAVSGGIDLARQAVVDAPGPQLHYFDEAFSSENMLVRIFALKPRNSVGIDWRKAAAALD
jgi:dolichyl-diphosphooligosaccharide--protein glycosyltransferase